MSDNRIKKFMCIMLSSIMLISVFPALIHAEENSDTVSNEHYSISGELTNDTLNVVINDKIGNENIKAYIAEYDNEKLVKIEMKTELQTGENRIAYLLDDKTDVVKIFLWKDEMTPVIDVFKKEVNASPTTTPTGSPSSSPTASPTPSPSPTASPTASPTTTPSDKKTAEITIKYVDEENNNLKDDVVLSEKYNDGDTYTITDNLKSDFTIKTEDGMYNIYTINESTSQLSMPFAPEMTVTLKFNNTAQYDYYENFENYAVDSSKWQLGSGANSPTVEENHSKYLHHSTTTSSNGGYTKFDAVNTTEKTAEIKADVMFTQMEKKYGLGQLSIGNTDVTFNQNKIQYGINDTSTGHILVIQYSEGSTFKINNTDISDVCTADKWLSIKADADFSAKTVTVTVTNEDGKTKTFEDKFYSSSVESNLGSVYLRSPGTNGSVSVDNITVKITGNAGPVIPNIESPINYKSVYAFGDSIVYGHKTPKQSFMQLIANDYSIKLNMMAKNGATIMPSKNHILSQINNAPAIAPDFVVFEGYTNDAYGSVETDSFNSDGTNKDVTQCYGEITADGTTEFDTNTFCGAFEQTIYAMKQKWQTSKFVFVTIHKSGARNMEIQTKLHDLSVAICKKWNVEVVDMFTDSTLDTTDAEQMSKYMIDGKGSHPNVAACKEFYIPVVVSKLENLCDNGTEVSPSPSPTVSPTASPTATPTVSPTPSPTASPTPSPTATPTASPSPSPTVTPTPNIAATYKFDFGNGIAAEGYTAVTPDMVYDMSKTDAQEGYCGFLGTTENSFTDDVLSYNMDNRAIDGFSLVKGQKITLSSGGEASNTNADSDYISVPQKANYIPESSSEYEGRYPIRFSMKADRASYYTVTATLTNSSSTENACVSLFSEKRQIVAEDVTIKPNEKITFKFSVDIEDVYYKMYERSFNDDMLNISVTGENAAISSLIVEKHGKTDGTIKGEVSEGGVNDGTTMWLCTDSTGCDYGATVPFFALQNYAGSGQAFIKYAPENIAISNQGERGLATVDNAHFNKCNLKPGDYLYVQYGHNETGGADTYYANLSKYYDVAEKSGAKMIIASPVNRHQNASLVDGKWQSDFGAYIEKAEQFVKEKIDAGKTNIAFVDLNKLYVNWMNEETARIKAINPLLDEQGAMSFYYRSVKGSSIDGTHMNDAGADQAAYCFFMAAKEIVAAADNGSEDKYVTAQAEVVRPLTEGMKTKIGNSEIDNLPMTVSDEIINTGKAPNSYWDTVPTDLLEYDNSAAVDSVGAVTNEDGSMIISSVGMRIMNSGLTYAKAVVTVNNNGKETKYYTENNYDCTGDEVGTVKVNTGFITSDKDHSAVTDTDKVSEIIVPKDAECSVQIVSCNDNWIVGDNPTVYSAIYNVYPTLETVFNENGVSVDGWSRLTGASEYSETVTDDTDGSKYIAILSNNADASGTKKNYGFYKALNQEITSGRYRLSFKTRFNAGIVRFALASTIQNASNPFPDKTYVLGIKSGNIYMNDEKIAIPTITKEDGTTDAKINASQWINVDSILDLNSGKILISVAGSDYTEFDIADWQGNSPSTLPIKYFGIAGSGDGTATNADVKDIKLISIPQEILEQKTVSVNLSDSSMGKILINNEEATEKTIDISSSVTLKAVANDGYKFVSWTDESDNVLSEAAEYTIPRLYNNVTLTANFEVRPQNGILWNFSDLTTQVDTPATDAQEVEYNGLKINIGNNDTLTNSGLYWSAKGTQGEEDTAARFIHYKPATAGTLKFTIKAGTVDAKQNPRLYFNKGTDETATVKKPLNSVTGAYQSITKAETDTVLSYTLEANQDYVFWTYIYGSSRKSNFTISQIEFTPAS